MLDEKEREKKRSRELQFVERRYWCEEHCGSNAERNRRCERMVLSVDPSPRTLVRRSSKKTLRLSVYRRKI